MVEHEEIMWTKTFEACLNIIFDPFKQHLTRINDNVMHSIMHSILFQSFTYFHRADGFLEG